VFRGKVFQRILDHLAVVPLDEVVVGFAAAQGPAIVVRKAGVGLPPIRGYAAILLPLSVVIQVKPWPDFV
jgi:hypothetical protein